MPSAVCEQIRRVERLFRGTAPFPPDLELGTLVTGYSPSEGATLIFFDANNNGVQDEGELGVQPEGNGIYSFVDLESTRLNNLGGLDRSTPTETGVSTLKRVASCCMAGTTRTLDWKILGN